MQNDQRSNSFIILISHSKPTPLTNRNVSDWCKVCLLVIKHCNFPMKQKKTTHAEDRTRTHCQGKIFFATHKHKFWHFTGRCCQSSCLWPCLFLVLCLCLDFNVEISSGTLDGRLLSKSINQINLIKIIINECKGLLQTVTWWLMMIDSKEFICLFLSFYTQGLFHSQADSSAAQDLPITPQKITLSTDKSPQIWPPTHCQWSQRKSVCDDGTF